MSFIHRLRERFFPFLDADYPRLIAVLLIKFFISLNYTFVTGIKDTVIMDNGGTAAILAIKGWLTLPAAFIAISLYARIVDRVGARRAFYYAIVPFALYFLLYGTWLYPNRDLLVPTPLIAWLETTLSPQRYYLLSIVQYWPDTLYYILSDLWSSVCISLLFWNLANSLHSVQQAKRFYALISGIGDLAGIIAGMMVKYDPWVSDANVFSTRIFVINLYFFVSVLFTIALYFYVDQRYPSPKQVKVKTGKKSAIGFFGCMQWLKRSAYLRSMAILSICYPVTLLLVETVWKTLVKEHYPSPIDYHAFNNSFLIINALVALVVTIVLGTGALQYFSWRIAALITPICVCASAFCFYLFFFSPLLAQPFADFLHIGPLTLLVFVGAIQVVLSKCCKYTFFDTTKEMAYIPLDDELKTKGKAAVDVASYRLGKAGGSWVQLFLVDIVGRGSALQAATFNPLLLLLLCFVWIRATLFLATQFEQTQRASAP